MASFASLRAGLAVAGAAQGMRGRAVLARALGCILASGLVSAYATPAHAQDADLEIGGAPGNAPAPPAEPAPAATTVVTVVKGATAPSPSPVAASRDEVEALRQEIRVLRESIKTAEPPPPPAEAPAVPPPPPPFIEMWPTNRSTTTPWESTPHDGLFVQGYVQSQYESHQDSQDQLQQGGALLNRDRFLIRRARLKVLGEWKWAKAQIELNGDTTNGFNMNLHHAEATVQYRPDRTKVPILQATLGLFDTPFGYELPESPRTRPFMERSMASRAFWPGEPDLGVRVSGGYDFVRYTVAAVNGHPLNEPLYAGRDPIGAKDVMLRVGIDTRPNERSRVAFDISALTGKGFHPGTDATKSSLQWVDLNDDGIVQSFELQSSPAAAPTPSQTFEHWAIGADLQASYRWKDLGETKIYGEVIVAQNLDRGYLVADPILATTDTRELGFYLGATQEVTKWGLVGLRYDYYDPNSDFLDKRSGRTWPTSQSVKTLSPIVGLVLPERAKLLFQYDVLRNFLARTSDGTPTNLKSNTWTLRLQVEL